jgi:SAM-dependent methyltransferase
MAPGVVRRVKLAATAMARRALQIGRQPSRTDYKRVWNSLAATYPSAVAHVQGVANEIELQATGEQTAANLRETIGINTTDVVVEIGCGIGRVGKIIAPLCQEWIGCDVSANMLAHAQARLNGLPNVRFVEISGVDLQPLPDNSADLVYCTVVFMHLDEWDRFNYVLEAKRILRPGGRIFVDNLSLCQDMGWSVFESLRTGFAPDERPAHISKSSTPAEIEVYLQRAEFRPVTVREKDGWVQGWGYRA